MKINSKEDLDEYLLKLKAEGHSMRYDEFPRRITYEIVKHYGTYRNAKDELNIEIKRKPYVLSASNERKRKPHKWNDEKIRSELKEAVTKYSTTSSTQLSKKGYRNLVDAVRRHYGTWNAGLVAFGYEVAYEYRSPDDNLSKEETKERVLNALASGIKPTRGALEKEIRGLKRSIEFNFEGINGLKEYCGFCAISDKPSEYKEPKTYRPKLSTAEGIKREIIRMWYIGAPMNYTYVKKKRCHLLEAVNKHIGSWKHAVESIGINYSEVTKQGSTNVLSECGTEFEEVFAELLTELNYKYIREGEGIDEVIPDFKLKPDFILPNWRWIDCKLSEWSDIRETIIRYHEEEPNGITIVYLRGRNHRIERGRKWKYEHISVYQFTKQLPKERQQYYESILRNIERRADEGAVAI